MGMKILKPSNKVVQTQMLIIQQFEMYLLAFVYPEAVCLHFTQTPVYRFLLQCWAVFLACV